MNEKNIQHIERDSNGKFVKGHKAIGGFISRFKKGRKHIVTKETRNKISISHKKRFIENPELRKQIGIQTKRLMKEGKIKGFQKGKDNVAKRPEVRKILSVKTKEQMRLHPTKGMLGKHHSQKSKDNVSINNKGKVAWNKGLKGVMVAWNKGMNKEEFKSHYKNGFSIKLIGKVQQGENHPMFGKYHTSEAKIKIKKARAKQIFPLKDSEIELKIQKFLKQLNIDFFTHQYIKDIEHGYQCDILIPSMNLVIECDGDYWHKYPIGNEIDHIRTSELIEKGFKVLRLWECDIIKMDLNDFKERLL